MDKKTNRLTSMWLQKHIRKTTIFKEFSMGHQSKRAPCITNAPRYHILIDTEGCFMAISK
jgi:hypothetical protein